MGGILSYFITNSRVDPDPTAEVSDEHHPNSSPYATDDDNEEPARRISDYSEDYDIDKKCDDYIDRFHKRMANDLPDDPDETPIRRRISVSKDVDINKSSDDYIDKFHKRIADKDLHHQETPRRKISDSEYDIDSKCDDYIAMVHKRIADLPPESYQ